MSANPSAASNPTPIAVPVLGMHRSGTSMVSRMLEAGGVFFGSKEKLAGPSADNVLGFWEHEELRQINEKLLSLMQGSWRNPPQVDAQICAQQGNLRAEAEQLISQLSKEGGFWGWKDPRTSLLLPFWKPLLKQPRHWVVCLRHPQEVAESLYQRNGISYLLSSFLWQEYLASICQQLQGEAVLVVAYAEVLKSPLQQANRLAAFLRKPKDSHEASKLNVEKMAAAVEGHLAHHQCHGNFTAWWPGGEELYEQLQACACDQKPWSACAQSLRPPRDSAFSELMAESAHLSEELDIAVHANKDRTNETLLAVQERETMEAELEELKVQLQQAEDLICQRNEELEELQAQMDNLLSRKEVRVGQKVRHLVRRLNPKSTS